MCVYVYLPEFMCIRCLQIPTQDQREHGILWNQSQVVCVSHHVGAGDQISVLDKSSKST